MVQCKNDFMMKDKLKINLPGAIIGCDTMTEKDIDDIQISTRRITSRGGKITQIDVDDDSASGDTPELPV